MEPGPGMDAEARMEETEVESGGKYPSDAEDHDEFNLGDMW